MEPAKTCIKCGILKKRSAFRFMRPNSDRRRSACRECDLVQMRSWSKRNYSKRLTYHREWIAKNKDKKRKWDREWRIRNPDHLSAKNKRHVNAAATWYIRALLRREGASDLSSAAVAQKKEHLIAKRADIQNRKSAAQITCSKCAKTKPRSEFFKKKLRTCKTCLNADSTNSKRQHKTIVKESHRRWCAENMPALRQAVRSRYRKNPEYRVHAIQNARKWAQLNPDKLHEIKLRSGRKARTDLANSYVKYVIAKDIGLPTSAIPEELIEAKREYVKLKRLIKEKQNAQQESSDENP